jgi:hypothetical protein
MWAPVSTVEPLFVTRVETSTEPAGPLWGWTWQVLKAHTETRSAKPSGSGEWADLRLSTLLELLLAPQWALA